jgi:trehalose synthase
VKGLAELMDYAPIVGEELISKLYSLSDEIRGTVVQNINSTSEGGGVAEILSRIVPLLKQIGIDATWDVLKGDSPFFSITKKFHNALQGMNADITAEDLAHFLAVNQENAEEIDLYGDIIFIHDPQPIALIEKEGAKIRKRWIWRCHIDLTEPQREIMDFLRRYIERYDCIVISSPQYARKDINVKNAIIPPSIDPLSDKNRDLPQATIDSVLERFGIDKTRPVVTQVSRFDRFKNPWGVVEIYKKVKKYNDLQLVLAGGGANDDPEGPDILKQLKGAVKSDPDIHIIDLPPYSDIDINALQRASTVILQNSSREGFGLTVTEALWKARPVIASAVGGIPLQISHEHSGILTHSVEEAECYLRKLLNEPQFAMRLGMNGREYVRKNFLITRHIRDCLLLFKSLNGEKRVPGRLNA